MGNTAMVCNVWLASLMCFAEGLGAKQDKKGNNSTNKDIGTKRQLWSD